MRTEKQIYDTILNYAKMDERIRMVTLEGSRTNIIIPPDDFQDYDITFFCYRYAEFHKWRQLVGCVWREINSSKT